MINNILLKSLNDKNKDLYEKLLSDDIEIEFEVKPATDCWAVGQIYKITAPNDEPNPAGFAHELLHIKLYRQGFADNVWIYTHYNDYNSAFTVDFIGNLNNGLAHFKMLDDFLAMGFHVDEFLQDTPKAYFLSNIFMHITKLQIEKRIGTVDIAKQALEITIICSGIKLFGKYKVKDPNTVNGLDAPSVIDMLKEINPELVEHLDKLFDSWDHQHTFDNLEFFTHLNKIFKVLNIPNALVKPAQ